MGAEYADIVLPAATWGEDNFTRCNSERRLRLYSKFYDAPGDAKPDWWAVQKFAHKMGFSSYDWKNSNDVFEEAARFGRNGVLNYHPLVVKAKELRTPAQELLRTYGTGGIQTPIRMKDGKLIGTPRLHDPANDWDEIEGPEVKRQWLHAFNTHSGKAILLKSPWKFAGWIQFYDAVKPRAEKSEIWVTNGRINETWQSGFDDLRKPYMSQRWPYPFLIVHPNDAKKKGIESGDFVQVHNDTVYVQTGQPQGVLDADLNFNNLMKDGHIKTTEGQFVAVAIVSDEMREGVAMGNFNFPGAPANSVVSAVPDPVTNNYRYKLGRGVLTNAIRESHSPGCLPVFFCRVDKHVVGWLRTPYRPSSRALEGIRKELTAKDLKTTIVAYSTDVSDVGYMFVSVAVRARKDRRSDALRAKLRPAWIKVPLLRSGAWTGASKPHHCKLGR
ncbi:MAG: molybdopterin-dependent oxidoreductase [Betaproteobacteria bacterium]|nr:molybdopterin-dependent oxidoreductase [Betaproteobacteria bacterium]